MQNEELIPKADLDRIIAYGQEVIRLNAALAQTAVELAKFSKNPSAGGNTSGSQSGTPTNTKPAERLTALEAERLRIGKEVQKAYAQQQAILQGNTGILLKERAVRDNMLLIERNKAKEMAFEEGSLNRMRATLNRMLAEQTNINVSTAAGKKQYDDMGVSITNLTSKISGMEQARGQFGRNVGNYASGFNPLNFQIQQLARELPSLTVSTQQFFLAISNNLPMLVDQMKVAEAANAALKNEGKATVPVWKQMLGGILSWQTAIVVGITLITAYGKEIGNWVKEIFSSIDATDLMATSIENVNNEISNTDIGKSISDYEKLADNYRNIGDNAKEKQKFIEDYREELDNTGVSVKNINDADNIFIENSSAYIQMLTLRAKAQAASTLAEKEYEKAIIRQVKNENDRQTALNRIEKLRTKPADYTETRIIGSSSTGYVQTNTLNRDDLIAEQQLFLDSMDKREDKLWEQGNVYTTISNQMIADAENVRKNAQFSIIPDPAKGSGGRGRSAALKDTLKVMEREREAIEDLTEEEYRLRIWTNKQIADDEEASLSDRIQANKRYYELQIEQIQKLAEVQKNNIVKEREDKLVVAKKEEKAETTRVDIDEVILTEEEMQAIRVQAAEDTGMQIKVINTKAYNDLRILAQDYTNDWLDIYNDATSQDLQLFEKTQSEKEQALHSSYANGEMSYASYQEGLTALTQTEATDRLNIEIDALQSLIEMEDLTADERYEIQKQLSEKIRALGIAQSSESADRAKQQADNAKTASDAWKKFAIDAAQEVSDFMFAQIDAVFEKRIEALEKEFEAAEEATDVEKERIDRLEEHGAITKEQANARKALADQMLDEKEKQIEARKKEEQLKQAKWQKAQNITNIMLNTASAIMAAAAVPIIGLTVLVPIAAALGALQLGLALATPLPKYSHGTGFHEGGLAVVGDGGRSEMAVYGGHYYKTPDVPTLVDLPRGAEVLPDYNFALQSMLREGVIRPDGYQRDLPADTRPAYDDRAVVAMLDKNNRSIGLFMKSYNHEKGNRLFDAFKNNVSKKHIIN